MPSLNAKSMGEYKDEHYREISREQTVLYNTVTWDKIIAETRTDLPRGNVAGYGSSGPIDPNTWYGQQINVLNVPRLVDSNGEQLYQVVPWSVMDKNNNRWSFAGATAIAEDFEAKHPDYIVLGGINGDFYDWHTTLDYPNCGSGMEVLDGEVIRSLVIGWGAVGIKNTTEHADQLVHNFPIDYSTISDKFYLQILNEENEVTDEIELTGINCESLSDGQISAYFGTFEIVYIYDDNGNHVLNSYDEWAIEKRVYHAPTLPEGTKFYINNSDLVVSQAGQNSFYAKGTIDSLEDSTVEQQQFAICSKNSTFNKLLNEGVKIRVQRKLIGNFEGIKNALGCYKSLVVDGEFSELYNNEDYFYTRAPRTLIGCKSDGTITLITMDGRQAALNMYGTNQEEIDGVLDALDITSAYLMDGGGSTTFFVRENNKFVVKNSPSDGRQRSVANGFLVVVKKDTTITVDNVEVTSDQATFTLKSNGSYEKAYVRIGDKYYEAENDKVVITGLNHNTEYPYTIYYKTSFGSLVPTTATASFTTYKITPSVKLGDFRTDSEYVYPNLIIDDPDKAIEIIIIYCGNKSLVYSMDGSEENKILLNNGSSDCSIIYSYKLGSKAPIQRITLEYTVSTNQHSSDSKSGCRSGLVFLIPIIACSGLVLVLLKKRR